MRICILDARAKINLFLEIIRKRDDGFHEVAMILQSIDLSDQIQLSLTDGDMVLTCDHPEVPQDHTNLAIKAARLMKETYGCPGGVAIDIEKRIPVAAGLAGGSTNAAAVLVGLNQLWQLGLTIGDLQELSAQIGSDIPFCVNGGTQLATGRGEILEPLLDLKGIPLILAKPRNFGISTAWAYRAYHETPAPARPEGGMHEMLSAISQSDPQAIGHHLFNDLEFPAITHHQPISALKNRLLQAGAIGAMMSGSGPSVFAIMPSWEHATETRDQLATEDPATDYWATTTTPTGISLELVQDP